MRRTSGALLSLLAASCGEDAATFYVDLVTDVVPGVEFALVRVELDDRQDALEASLGDDFERGCGWPRSPN